MDIRKIRFLAFNTIFTCLFTGVLCTSVFLASQYSIAMMLSGSPGDYIVNYLGYFVTALCSVFFLLAIWIAFAKLFKGRWNKLHTVFMILATILMGAFLLSYFFVLGKYIVRISNGADGPTFAHGIMSLFWGNGHSQTNANIIIIPIMIFALVYGWIFMSSVKKRNMKMSANNESVHQAGSAYAPSNINSCESSDSNTATTGEGQAGKAEQSISYYKGNYPY